MSRDDIQAQLKNHFQHQATGLELYNPEEEWDGEEESEDGGGNSDTESADEKDEESVQLQIIRDDDQKAGPSGAEEDPEQVRGGERQTLQLQLDDYWRQSKAAASSHEELMARLDRQATAHRSKMEDDFRKQQRMLFDQVKHSLVERIVLVSNARYSVHVLESHFFLFFSGWRLCKAHHSLEQPPDEDLQGVVAHASRTSRYGNRRSTRRTSGDPFNFICALSLCNWKQP